MLKINLIYKYFSGIFQEIITFDLLSKSVYNGIYILVRTYVLEVVFWILKLNLVYYLQQLNTMFLVLQVVVIEKIRKMV